MRSYVARSILQTAVILTPAVLTFVCAGTIAFWQGWLFWAVFLLCTTATGIYLRISDPALLERRMHAGPAAEPRPFQKVVMSAIVAMFAGIAVLSGLDHRFGWSQVPAAAVIIANVAVMLCFGLFIVVLHENTFAASNVTVEAGQRVVSTGLYAYVRHPMYTGGLLLIFAMPVAMGSYWGLILSALATPFLIARIFDEE